MEKNINTKDSNLSLAKHKFKRSKYIDINQSVIDYICECYLNLNPCSYGARIQNFICGLLGLKVVSSRLNCGDFKYKDTYGEFKVTYLGQNNGYNITHIRPWQKFKYYLIMFIDCSNEFTPEFYFIHKNTFNKFKLGSMVGTKETNQDNLNVDLRTYIVKGSTEHKTLAKHNLLKGTSIDDLKEYVFSNLNNSEKLKSPLRKSIKSLPKTVTKNKSIMGNIGQRDVINGKDRKTLKIFINDTEIYGDNIIDKIIKVGNVLSEVYGKDLLVEKLPTYFKLNRTDLPISMMEGNRNHYIRLGNDLYFTTWGKIEQKKSMIETICKRLSINNIKCVVE